jgi:hypothetical protein
MKSDRIGGLDHPISFAVCYLIYAITFDSWLLSINTVSCLSKSRGVYCHHTSQETGREHEGEQMCGGPCKKARSQINGEERHAAIMNQGFGIGGLLTASHFHLPCSRFCDDRRRSSGKVLRVNWHCRREMQAKSVDFCFDTPMISILILKMGDMISGVSCWRWSNRIPRRSENA